MAWDFDKIYQRLNDSLIVMDAIQRRQGDRIDDHRQWLESLTKASETHRQALELHQRVLENLSKARENEQQFRENEQQFIERHEHWLQEHELTMKKLDLKLLEIGEKLDALINFVDQQSRRPNQQNGGESPPAQ